MSLYDSLYRSYSNREIGAADIRKAAKSGIISEYEAGLILDVPVKYSLELAKKFKKEELSLACQSAIGDGVDVPLTDGGVKHFSLTDHDQTNLTAKMMNILAGETSFEYHSDGDPCMYYGADDMARICVAAQQKVSFETTYYNCLCQWMNALTVSDEVMAINYGSDIPEAYWSDPYRTYMETLVAQQKAEATKTTEGADANTDALAQDETMETGPAEEEAVPVKKARKKKS